MDAERDQQSTMDGSEIMLALLSSVEQNHQVTQRTLATELGIALGLANSYLKRCITKGLIKISSVPPRRYSYYLTPEGFIEKSRLTSEYLQASFGFFRQARQQCEQMIGVSEARGWKKAVLYGASDLAEVALLCSRERGTNIIGVVDPNGATVGGLPSVTDISGITGWDGVLLTALKNPQAAYDRLAAQISPDLILAPRMLRISRKAEAATDAARTAS